MASLQKFINKVNKFVGVDDIYLTKKKILQLDMYLHGMTKMVNFIYQM